MNQINDEWLEKVIGYVKKIEQDIKRVEGQDSFTAGYMTLAEHIVNTVKCSSSYDAETMLVYLMHSISNNTANIRSMK